MQMRVTIVLFWSQVVESEVLLFDRLVAVETTSTETPIRISKCLLGAHRLFVVADDVKRRAAAIDARKCDLRVRHLHNRMRGNSFLQRLHTAALSPTALLIGLSVSLNQPP